MADKTTAAHTARVLLMTMTKNRSEAEVILILRHAPENCNIPYKANGVIRNTAEANRFLFAIVP